MTSASSFRNGRLHRYYRCRTRDKQGKSVCPTTQLPAEAIESFVVEQVQAAITERGEQLQPHLEALGWHQIGSALEIWEALTPANQRRWVQVLVEEVSIDERLGKLSLRFRDFSTQAPI